MKKFLIISILFTTSYLFISCGNRNNKEGEDNSEVFHSEEGHSEESSNIVTLTTDQVKNIGIEWGVIEQKQLTASIKTNGVLKVPNQNKATITSLYNGVIKSLLVQPGNSVKKGQVIATLTNPEFVKIQSDYLNTNAKISLAELEVKRQKELNAGNAGALKNLQSAETELRTLQTAKSTFEQQIRLMGINPAKLSNGKLIFELSIKSPISGVVSEVKAEIGSFIDVSSIVAEVVDNSQLHLDLFVYEKDLPQLRNNQLIHFTLTNNPGKEYDAQIFSLGSSFEGNSKAVLVHAKVQGDKSGLIDGMNVTAVISLNQKTVPAVPNDAIVTVEGQDYIFVFSEEQKNKNSQDSLDASHNMKSGDNEFTFERIPVAKGTSDVGFTEITLLKEIPKEAKIIIKGAFFVSAKMTNTEGHEH